MRVILLLLLTFSAHANTSKLEHEFAPEISDAKICGPRSSYNRFITEQKLFTLDVIVLDYSELNCEGNVSLYSGSAGSKLIVLTKVTGKVLLESNVYNFSVTNRGLSLTTKVPLSECKSGAKLHVLSKNKYGKIIKANLCL